MPQMKHQDPQDLGGTSPVPRETVLMWVRQDAAADQLKERVYATFTGLAVVLILVVEADHLTPGQAMLRLGASVVAICTAGFISDVIAHASVTGQTARGWELRSMFTAALGGVVTVLVPLLIAVGSLLTWYSLEAALYATVVVYVLTLVIIVHNAVRRTSLSWGAQAAALGAILLVGALFIALELLADFGGLLA